MNKRERANRNLQDLFSQIPKQTPKVVSIEQHKILRADLDFFKIIAFIFIVAFLIVTWQAKQAKQKLKAMAHPLPAINTKNLYPHIYMHCSRCNTVEKKTSVKDTHHVCVNKLFNTGDGKKLTFFVVDGDSAKRIVSGRRKLTNRDKLFVINIE